MLPISFSPAPSARRLLAPGARRASRTTPSCNSLSTRDSRKSPKAAASSNSSLTDVVSALADITRRATASFLAPPRSPTFPPGPAEDVAPAFLADPLGTLESLEARFGGVVGVLLGGERVVIVGGRGGALAAADVLLDPCRSFTKAGTAFFPGSDVTGNGLLTSDGDEWKRQRALATPAFRRAAVEAYGTAMAREAEATAARDWSGSRAASSSASRLSRNLYSDFNSLTLRVVTTALFGSRLDDGEGSRVASAVDAAFARFAAAGVLGGSGGGGSQLILELLPEWFPGGGGGGKVFKKAVADLDEVVYEIIVSRRRKLEGKREREEGSKEKDDGDDSGEKVSFEVFSLSSFPSFFLLYKKSK